MLIYRLLWPTPSFYEHVCECVRVILWFMRIKSSWRHQFWMPQKVTSCSLWVVIYLVTICLWAQWKCNSYLGHVTIDVRLVKQDTTRHVFIKHGCPRRQQSENMIKISKSYILTLPNPQGHVMSVKCEQTHRWTSQSKFGYCIITQTLNIALCL